MTNQSGSAFWTCAVCGAMGSALDSSCPNCGSARGTPAVAVSPAVPSPSAFPVVQTTAPAAQTPGTTTRSWLSADCRACGAPNSWLSATCVACGATLQMSAAGRTPRQRGLAALLAFVGGVVGAQYFYMGRYAAGVACVVMCWTGYSLALGFIDGMRLLTLTDSEFARECVS